MTSILLAPRASFLKRAAFALELVAFLPVWAAIYFRYAGRAQLIWRADTPKEIGVLYGRSIAADIKHWQGPVLYRWAATRYLRGNR